MCAITGLIDPQGHRHAAALQQICAAMTAQVAHRGPDDAGQWMDESARVAFGHRRLSIIDLSPEGHQPMVSQDGRYVIVYNGEIYNYRDLRAELVNCGVSFRGNSDTEVLIEGHARWGLRATIERANGIFALAIWDRKERKLSLARDRFGQKPLYYGWAGRALVFGSELKAITAHPDFAGLPERRALSLFVRHGYVPEPWSIWTDIFKLPPASILEIDTRHIEAHVLPAPVPYWSVRAAEEAGRHDRIDDPEAALDVLHETLKMAVRECMVSDVPIGAFLSGGIDSSTVVALMQEQSSSPVRTFSIGFRERRYDEAQYAIAVARHLGTDHRELYVTHEDALNVVPLLPRMYDEPFADSSQIPTYLISKLARADVTVSLTGDGGDEVFGGYNRYVWGERVQRAIRLGHGHLSRFAASASRAISPAAWDRLAGRLPGAARLAQPGDKIHKLADLLDAASGEEAYLRLTSQWHEPGCVVTGADEPATVLNDPSRWPPASSFAEQMMVLDAETYLPGDILTKVDRASMAVALESRIPLLDHRVAELAWRLPIGLKIRNGQSKWPLRAILQRYVPQALIDRPKMGFGVPLDSWLRGPLRDWAESLLDEHRLRQEGFFEAAPIRKRWQEHLEGNRNWQHALWVILMFQAWRDMQGAEAAARPEAALA
jgi:asparagine synthase (glutamine-hydrolysing)